MIEIKYNNGKIKIFHDGREYNKKNLMEHLFENGHSLEVIGFAVPLEVYTQCKKISEEVCTFFKERERIKKMKRKYQK